MRRYIALIAVLFLMAGCAGLSAPNLQGVSCPDTGFVHGYDQVETISADGTLYNAKLVDLNGGCSFPQKNTVRVRAVITAVAELLDDQEKTSFDLPVVVSVLDPAGEIVTRRTQILSLPVDEGYGATQQQIFETVSVSDLKQAGDYRIVIGLPQPSL